MKQNAGLGKLEHERRLDHERRGTDSTRANGGISEVANRFARPLTRARNAGAVAILVVFVALGGLYSVVNPIMESPDELFHYAVIKHIADGKGLPVQNPANKSELIGTESNQPPLYYLIGAAATAWIDTGPFERLAQINPSANIGGPGEHDNKNKVMHGRAHSFPYHGVPLAVHLVRFLSVAMGAGTVLLAYLIGLEAFSGSRTLAAGVAALTAFNPQFLYISGSVNNDNLVTLLSTATLLLAIRLVKGRITVDAIVAVALFASLAALSKVSGLAAVGLAGLGTLVGGLRQRSPATVLLGGAGTLAAVPIIAGWWYLRNWRLHGDLLGIDALAAMTGERIGARPSALAVLINENEGLRRSYWALFGWFNVAPDQIVYAVFDVIMTLAIVGLLVAIVRGLLSRSWSALPVYALLSLWAVVVFAGYLRWTTMVMASQGRLLFPAIAAFSALLVLGLSSLAPRRYCWLPVGLVVAVTLAMAVSLPFTTIAPAYAGPARISVQTLGEVPNPLNVNYGDRMELMGYRLSPTAVKPGGEVELTLYWRVLGSMDRDYTVYIHVLDAGEKIVGQKDSYPGGGALLTSELRPGEAFVYTDHLVLPAQTKAPGEGRIAIGLYDRATMERLPAMDRQRTTVPAAFTDVFRIVPR